MKLWPFCLFVSRFENLLTPHHRLYASHLFVKHIIYLTSFQVLKSHRETALGSHYRPFIGSRAQHAKESDALRLRSGAGTSKVECRHQPGDQPLCTSSLSRNKVIRSLNTTVLVKSHAIDMLWWLGFASKYLGEEHRDKNKTEQDLIPPEAQWGVRRHGTVFFPFFSMMKTFSNFNKIYLESRGRAELSPSPTSHFHKTEEELNWEKKMILILQNFSRMTLHSLSPSRVFFFHLSLCYSSSKTTPSSSMINPFRAKSTRDSQLPCANTQRLLP